MTHVSRERLLRGKRSLYALVLAAAARANQINEGAAPLIDMGFRKSAAIALEEIAEGKIRYEYVVNKGKNAE